jgi:adenylate kinase
MDRRYKSILLLGAPGSGKGTQGKMLGSLLGFLHVSSGDMFRALDRQSELGRLFREYASQGLLVPDEFTVQLWQNHIERLVENKRFRPDTDVLVLDGIPRNVAQARMLDPYLDVQKVIILRVEHDLEQVVERMKQRAIKEGRQDDASEATIRNRFRVYETETKPVIEHYRTDIRIEINGLQGGPVPVAHDIFAGLLGRLHEMKPVPR